MNQAFFSVPVAPDKGVRCHHYEQETGIDLESRDNNCITPGYVFTDYRAQAQKIEYYVVDVGTPPSGELTPIYTLRSRRRDNIRLLRDFDERLFMRHPNKHLREEHIQLQRLDRASGLNRAG